MSHRKVSCVHCRRLKRKCDGKHPCTNCVRRNIQCEYSRTDRRSQRFSSVYIKSLETNVEIYESLLSEMISLRHDKEALALKLELAALTFPLASHRIPDADDLLDNEDKLADIQPKLDLLDDEPHLDREKNYFGPGLIFHFGKYDNLDLLLLEPPSNPPAVPTWKEDPAKVTAVGLDFFRHNCPLLNTYFLDHRLLMEQLERGEVSDGLNGDNGDNVKSANVLTEPLLYAICCNLSILSNDEADAYREMAYQELSLEPYSSLLVLAQTYMLLGAHDLSKGKVSTGWILSGIAIRMVSELGIHTVPQGLIPSFNRLLMGFYLIDTFICIGLGRPASIQPNGLPVLRLPLDLDEHFHILEKTILLLELTRPMLKATYDIARINHDPRVNYLLKFNQLKNFTVKVFKWKSQLPPALHWLVKLLKATSSRDLVTENHLLRFFYYYVLLFINKPFLHVPRKYAAHSVIEEISKDCFIIILAFLEHMKQQHRPVHCQLLDNFHYVRGDSSDFYQWLTVPNCMLTLLCHGIVTLIMSHPDHYIYLEKHLKVFTRYLNVVSLRKYKGKDNAMERLLTNYFLWKSKNNIAGKNPYEMKKLKELIDSLPLSLLSQCTSECGSHTSTRETTLPSHQTPQNVPHHYVTTEQHHQAPPQYVPPMPNPTFPVEPEKSNLMDIYYSAMSQPFSTQTNAYFTAYEDLNQRQIDEELNWNAAQMFGIKPDMFVKDFDFDSLFRDSTFYEQAANSNYT